MNSFRNGSIAYVAGTLGLIYSISALAQTPPTPGLIADNESLFIDGSSFTVTPGKAKIDASSLIDLLGAGDFGPGAIIFRSGEKLYVVDAPLLASRGPDRSVYVTAETAQTNRIRIEYVPPKSPELQETYDHIKMIHGLETMQKILGPLVLPEDLTITTKECGIINSWYLREDSKPTITICYEMLRQVMQSLPEDKTPRLGITRADAEAGQFFWLVTHETGHALFDIFDIPVLGHEEDAADDFATYLMLAFGKEQARRLIGGAAWAYKEYISDYRTNPEVKIRLAGFASNHGQPENVFYNLMCMAYGAIGNICRCDRGRVPATQPVVNLQDRI